ncbi:MAG TPA: hypothetical protein VK979_03785 [Guyparkeria sp.]|nr:hypothetical protein [Guyparkeria sp.]HZJ81921.1 hypothetical protein [Guyparkeria sp.]
MIIQRSTFEFLLIAIILASVLATSLWFGHGAGMLLLVTWGIAVAIYLKRKAKRDQPRD